jgi:ketosteroid isomerase-like protein
MAAEQIELTRRAFEAFNARDLESMLDLFDPDVQVLSLMTEAEGSTYCGHEGVRTWFETITDVFPDTTPEMCEVRETAEGVVAKININVVGVASGVRFDQSYYHAVTSRGGKVTWFGFFRTEDEATAALAAQAAQRA